MEVAGRWGIPAPTGDFRGIIIWVWVNTYRYIFSGMNIHLPAILGFTRYQGFDPSPFVNGGFSIAMFDYQRLLYLSTKLASFQAYCRILLRKCPLFMSTSKNPTTILRVNVHDPRPIVDVAIKDRFSSSRLGYQFYPSTFSRRWPV